MAIGAHIRTYFDGKWHDGDVPIMKAADHGAWLGTTVFDGARFFEGIQPDLDAHCARVNRSAQALMITPTIDADQMVEIVREGLSSYSNDNGVYIRPMYWALDGGKMGVIPQEDATGFAICLEEIPMAPATASTTLTTTRFRRPVLEDAVVDAKAGCLYPNNARMLKEAHGKGYATANIFMVRDGEVFTPIANGCFLSGITRARHIKNMKADGIAVHETVLGFDDFRAADEVFLSGNMSKVTPVTEFDSTMYNSGPVTRRVRELYWDWAHSAS